MIKQRYDTEYYQRIGALGRESRVTNQRERQVNASLAHTALEEERKM